MLFRRSLLWLAANPTVRQQVVTRPVSRRIAQRFVAGERLEQALAVAADLNRQGALVTLDHLGENVTTADEAREVCRTYREVLGAVEQRGLKCNVSVKLTALGLDLDRELCLDNLRAIVTAARERDNFVRIDMEGSQYTQTTLDLFEQLFVGERLHNVGVVLQSYLRRTPDDVDRMNQIGARVRLCKGAYKEPATVAFPQKTDVDRQYTLLAQKLLEHGTYPALATHDPQMISAASNFAYAHGIGPQRFEFQQLYGVRRDIQRRLTAAGYTVRVYVPFGNAWYPYLMRRMAERPANLLFVLRSLVHS